MKKRSFFGVMTVFVLSVFITACSEGLGNADEDLALSQKSATLANSNCPGCNFSAVLTDAEKEGLLYMYQEEKMARDVYLKFAKLYPKTYVFSNIAKSEQAHMNAVYNLIKGYGLLSQIDKYAADFTTLYADLIGKGDDGLKEALEVGVWIENTDIGDLQEHIGETLVANILQVYKNLLAGSQSHLSAFTYNLSKL